MSEISKPVLVVGAGPVGLTTATELLRRGVPVRIVDKAAGASPLSKALLVWPRTLEILRRLGGDAHIAARGMPLNAFRYYSSGAPVGTLRFRPRTKPVILPQPDVEALLHDALTDAGGTVAWSTELLGVEQDDTGVRAVLRGPDGASHTEEFAYAVGCDGASSRVRELLGIPFDGATYPATFVVADIDMEGPLEHDTSHYYCSPQGVLVTCGLPNGRFRVFTSAPADLDRDHITLEQVQRLVDERGPGGLTLSDPVWISAFSVHARRAERTREGRVFLLGDAAHIHSPAGGQGLNTGVGDAHNLAWKLALVLRGAAAPGLLDTAAAERHQVAEAVVRQADVQTKLWMVRKPYQTALRDLLVRLGSAARIADLAYVPWLAGLRLVYGDRTGPRRRIGGHADGGLLTDREVWDARTARRRPLRTALDDDRYTLLVVSDGRPLPAATARAVRSAERLTGLVGVRYLDTTRQDLTDTAPAPAAYGRPRPRPLGRGPLLLLVRPDQHIALARRAADAHEILAALTRLAPAPARDGERVPVAA
ncbi:FAD-dependent monooxygenase [Streptomyces sp. L2]|uniref:FAD-dependent monooxygenase n=1 Tax=Streptomyces sp. L2 TaxID=2162665 RepID=UPI00101074B7|nr:FAD-dependent monooxygenase [Streptomyces sp. L2]